MGVTQVKAVIKEKQTKERRFRMEDGGVAQSNAAQRLRFIKYDINGTAYRILTKQELLCSFF